MGGPVRTSETTTASTEAGTSTATESVASAYAHARAWRRSTRWSESSTAESDASPGWRPACRRTFTAGQAALRDERHVAARVELGMHPAILACRTMNANGVVPPRVG